VIADSSKEASTKHWYFGALGFNQVTRGKKAQCTKRICDLLRQFPGSDGPLEAFAPDPMVAFARERP
jgi:hypothetical protein